MYVAILSVSRSHVVSHIVKSRICLRATGDEFESSRMLGVPSRSDTVVQCRQCVTSNMLLDPEITRHVRESARP
jgi:hypothetical protein